MAAIELKGRITEISKVEYVGEKKTAKQTFILSVAGWVDQFGDKKGKDEEWEIAILGDKVATVGLSPDKLKRKAVVKVIMNCFRVIPKDRPDAPPMFIINANLYDISFIDEK